MKTFLGLGLLLVAGLIVYSWYKKTLPGQSTTTKTGQPSTAGNTVSSVAPSASTAPSYQNGALSLYQDETLINQYLTSIASLGTILPSSTTGYTMTPLTLQQEAEIAAIPGYVGSSSNYSAPYP